LEKPITVKIFGNDYTIKSEEDSDKLYQIAEYVNKKVNEINENAEGLSEKKKAILVALDIANDYFQLMKEKDDLITNIRQRSKALLNNINSTIS
jgi:cell division protein ZapA